MLKDKRGGDGIGVQDVSGVRRHSVLGLPVARWVVPRVHGSRGQTGGVGMRGGGISQHAANVGIAVVDANVATNSRLHQAITCFEDTERVRVSFVASERGIAILYRPSGPRSM